MATKKIYKFTLIMGLFDKDSHQQETPSVAAYKIVNNLIAAQFDGGTVSDATGVYKHDNGDVVIEPSLRIELLFFDPKTIVQDTQTVKGFADELKRVFNQESIAVQKERIQSELW